MTRRISTTIARAAAAAMLLFSALPRAAMCQDDFVAIPRETAARYRFDFAHNFYASPEAERARRAVYYAGLKGLESLKGRVAASPQNLLRALRLYDAALVEFVRHYTYLYLRSAVNTKDEASGREASELDAEFSKRTAFLQQELMDVDARAFDRFVRLRPALAAYRFAVESARRYRPHTLSLREEEALAAAAPLGTDWESDLYAKLLRRTRFGSVKTRGGELDVRRQRAAVAASPDRAAREEGFKKLYAGYASQRDLYAFALTSLVRSRERLARLRRFADAPEEVFFKSGLSRAEVSTLLERVAGLAEVYKRYQRLRAEHARRRFGLSEVNLWDVTAGAEDARPPRFTIEEATARIREALAPLGPEYGRELASLLDPANGRMDVVPGGERRSGGFSKGFPGVTTVFYSGGFEGFYNDVRVLAHESTHAVHRQLMKNGGVPPVYAEGPHYLFESFAIFNELLLPEYLGRRETDASRRLFFLEQFFEGKGMTLFSVAQEESLELAVYDGVARGEVSTADDLDALAKRVGGRYSIWFDRHDELKSQWITSTLFYDDPLYDINYVYGSLLALKYYELYTRDPARFVPRYVALMKNGFDAPADVLLRRHLCIDLRDPRLVSDAARLLEEKLNQLEAEYSK
jgi:oligoendopeptidase F